MLHNACYVLSRYYNVTGMEAPKCRICGAKHYAMQPHVFKDAPNLAAPAAPATGKTKHCHTCRCFPMTAAERQKAYRERKRTA